MSLNALDPRVLFDRALAAGLSAEELKDAMISDKLVEKLVQLFRQGKWSGNVEWKSIMKVPMYLRKVITYLDVREYVQLQGAWKAPVTAVDSVTLSVIVANSPTGEAAEWQKHIFSSASQSCNQLVASARLLHGLFLRAVKRKSRTGACVIAAADRAALASADLATAALATAKRASKAAKIARVVHAK